MKYVIVIALTIFTLACDDEPNIQKPAPTSENLINIVLKEENLEAPEEPCIRHYKIYPDIFSIDDCGLGAFIDTSFYRDLTPQTWSELTDNIDLNYVFNTDQDDLDTSYSPVDAPRLTLTFITDSNEKSLIFNRNEYLNNIANRIYALKDSLVKNT